MKIKKISFAILLSIIILGNIYSQNSVEKYYFPPLNNEYKYENLNKDEIFTTYITFTKESENLYYETTKSMFEKKKVPKFGTYYTIENNSIIQVKDFNFLFGTSSETYKMIRCKYPNSTWKYFEKDKNGINIVEYNYKSEFGSAKTEYGFYENCIIITEIPIALKAKYEVATVYIHKYYYAYGIGLVKDDAINKKHITKNLIN